ncbi:Uncharacterised protein [Vibrio cholerae]|nr:Uncharacterised protein [Vibrio cholerae]
MRALIVAKPFCHRAALKMSAKFPLCVPLNFI